MTRAHMSLETLTMPTALPGPLPVVVMTQPVKLVGVTDNILVDSHRMGGHLDAGSSREQSAVVQGQRLTHNEIEAN